MGPLCNRLLGELDRHTFRPESCALTHVAGCQPREILLFWTARRHDIADSVAGGAGPMRAVEGKHARRDLRIADAAFDTGEFFAVEMHPAVISQHTDQPSGQL